MGHQLDAKRSNTRAAAALMSGASPGCTQPCQTSILRLCVFAGQGLPPAAAECARAGFGAAEAGPARCAAVRVNRRLCGTSARTVRRAILADRSGCGAVRPTHGRRRAVARSGRLQGRMPRRSGSSGSGQGGAGRCRRGCALERLQGIARGHVGSTRRTTLQHLLDQVDAAARTVPLVAQQSEGGTAERALTALHRDRAVRHPRCPG